MHKSFALGSFRDGFLAGDDSAELLEEQSFAEPLRDGMVVHGSLFKAVLNGTILCINILPNKVAFLMTTTPARTVLHLCALK